MILYDRRNRSALKLHTPTARAMPLRCTCAMPSTNESVLQLLMTGNLHTSFSLEHCCCCNQTMRAASWFHMCRDSSLSGSLKQAAGL